MEEEVKDVVELKDVMESRLRLVRRLVLLSVLLVAGLMAAGWLIGRSGGLDGWTPGSESLIRPVYLGAIVIGLLVVATRRLATSSLILRAMKQAGDGKALRMLTALSLVCAAVAVLVGIGGLYFHVITGDHQHSLRLGGVSVLLALYSLPRRDEWLKAVRG